MKVICTFETFEQTQKELFSLGYEWVSNGKRTLYTEDARKILHHSTHEIIIDCFYNEIKRKKELQFESANYYRKRGEL